MLGHTPFLTGTVLYIEYSMHIFCNDHSNVVIKHLCDKNM